MPDITNEDLFAKVCAVENEIRWMWKTMNEMKPIYGMLQGCETQIKKNNQEVDNFFDQMANWALKEATRLKNYD